METILEYRATYRGNGKENGNYNLIIILWAIYRVNIGVLEKKLETVISNIIISLSLRMDIPSSAKFHVRVRDG